MRRLFWNTRRLKANKIIVQENVPKIQGSSHLPKRISEGTDEIRATGGKKTVAKRETFFIDFAGYFEELTIDQYKFLTLSILINLKASDWKSVNIEKRIIIDEVSVRK